jgi:uncharacterized repeat protein (TIGR01451 family)
MRNRKPVMLRGLVALARTNGFKGRRRWLLVGASVAVLAAVAAGTAVAVLSNGPTKRPGATPLMKSEFGTALADRKSAGEDGGNEASLLLQRNQYFMDRRTAGNTPLNLAEAGAFRADAAQERKQLGHMHGLAPFAPATFNGAWSSIGPMGLNQPTRDSTNIIPVSGRVGALAIRQDGTRILGAAGGGIWVWDDATQSWVPKTDNLPSLHIGALAVAPSADNVVYAGTGEGALSGDSYFGNGILRSTDGGNTWKHVSGNYFYGVSISRLVVDPHNAKHLYAATLRGRGGSRRTSPALHSRFGIWESWNGGETWKLLKEAPDGTNGATDLELDPQNGDLYASFWGDAIYKSTNDGHTWATIMNGLPTDADYTVAPTRFSISLSHPANQAQATLYAGFEWYDTSGNHHPSVVFKSTDAGASWAALPTGSGQESVFDYCDGQCFYDNVVEADPTNPDVVFVAGVYDYNNGAGGIFRSTDGGQTWRNLGYDQHPDFHAVAFDPSNTQHVMIGSDGGVWYSTDLGGRPSASDPLSNADWQDLNATLSTTTFTSIATNPTQPSWVWGGSQDNGTEHTFGSPTSWYDLYSGDGGQVLVDPTDFNYVYGTYYGISPYRSTDGGTYFFSNQYIRNGIDLNDRSEFYVPWVMNPDNPNQLFLGTYRLYRTDNAKASSASSVTWKPISGDLTSGCTGPAPNGGRGCTISAVGVGGGHAVYTGSEEGYVYVSPDAQTSDDPTWTRIDKHLPKRPVASFAVDRSNYRVAYVAFDGFDAGTHDRPGHVFATADAGQHWRNISGNLPDVPVNSILLDPSYPNTLYIGTDVGAFVTYDGGRHWGVLGKGLPVDAIWQLSLDPSQPDMRTLAAGTYGRSAWELNDDRSIPAFDESTADSGTPIGPGKTIDYTLTLKNIGNADATGVTLTDPIPRNTKFAGAQDGGKYDRNKVIWKNLTVPAGGSVQLHFSATVNGKLPKNVTAIVNDGVNVTSHQRVGTTGSPFITPIAPPYGASFAPAAQSNGGQGPVDVDYHVTVTNQGFNDDAYVMSSTGSAAGFAVSFLDSTCTTPLASDTTPTVASGASTDVCVRVHVDLGATGDSIATVTATSTSDSTVASSGTVKTIGVGPNDALIVDEDANAPDVQQYYTDALTAAGVPYEVWDLGADGTTLPQAFLLDFKTVFWFTGNSYPDPIGPYESELSTFLDGGGHLFMSGQDILDQAAGTAPFFSNYIHLSWDGSETQNDKATATVTGVAGNPVTNGIGTIPLDHSVLGANFEDEVTPIGGALPAFMDDGTATGTSAPDALTYDNGAGSYKVVFLAFPMEAYGSATDKSDLVTRTMSFFGS